MKALAIFCSLAAVMWFVVFSPWTNPHINFWLAMTISSAALAFLALIIDRKNLGTIYSFQPKFIVIGVTSAVVLYLIFLMGHFISTKIFSFASDQIQKIYISRQQASPLTITLLLLFIIAPAEEIFWRGFVQTKLSTRLGQIKGLLLATFIYAIVHIWSFNFMLVASAAICGAFWGLLYYRYKSVWPVILSHAIWDMVIFVLLPIK